MDTFNDLTIWLDLIVRAVLHVITPSAVQLESGLSSFSVFFFPIFSSSGQGCTPDTCPGSFYTAVATAWANIGYLIHADVLRFLTDTDFGKWAILLYIVAAISALVGVATNSPMKNYTWFFIGPALFSFLVGTTTEVRGVNWVVANRAVSAQGMEEVWKNAEAGLANTRLVHDGLVKINGKYGPERPYEVAMPMVFLDELFSATSNILVEWTGIGRQVDNGGAESNLSSKRTFVGRQQNEAWWLLSNLKWGYVENITASTIRSPDLRDAFVSFIASECGDLFKQGIDSGSYIAASQSRGATVVDTVMVDNARADYFRFTELLLGASIATPRSLSRLFKEKALNLSNRPGSFMNFTGDLQTMKQQGRGHGIVCAEYLWTLIQGMRFEAGNAYYQMLRTAPIGFDEDGFVSTLLYGWDTRERVGKDIDISDQKAFIKHLILAYMLRNELISAPQITTVDQRYAPAEQARSYSEANIRAYGSKAKFIELYNAAVMMPYIQGILALFLIVAYPIACMLVILPGHYKGFITWVSFFAWIKLWDVGFAMVHVIERSVWAMLGNHSHMAATANTLISVARKVGGIGAQAPYGNGLVSQVSSFSSSSATSTSLEAANAVPVVCSLRPGVVDGMCSSLPGADQTYQQAFELFDKILLTGANLDLDLSNGWYIYIMAALYTAVPAITGQLVLGAKAGSAGLVKDAFQAVASDGAQAAKIGAQNAAVNSLLTNQKSIGQMAMAKALRAKGDGQSESLAMQAAKAGNDSFFEGIDGAKKKLSSGYESTIAGIPGKKLDGMTRALELHSKGVGGGIAGLARIGAAAKVKYGMEADNQSVNATALGQQLGYEAQGHELRGSALKDYSGKIGHRAEYEAQMAAWEAMNDFGAHASAMGGIAGMNAGALAPSSKPSDTTGMGMNGMLDSWNAVRKGDKAEAVMEPNNMYSDELFKPFNSIPDINKDIYDRGQEANENVMNAWGAAFNYSDGVLAALNGAKEMGSWAMTEAQREDVQKWALAKTPEAKKLSSDLESVLIQDVVDQTPVPNK